MPWKRSSQLSYSPKSLSHYTKVSIFLIVTGLYRLTHQIKCGIINNMENPFRRRRNQSHLDPEAEDQLRRERAVAGFLRAREAAQAAHAAQDQRDEQQDRRDEEQRRLLRTQQRVNTIVEGLMDADYFGAEMVPVMPRDGRKQKGPMREVPGWFLGVSRFGQQYHLTYEGMVMKRDVGYYTVEEIYAEDGGLQPLYEGLARWEVVLENFYDAQADPDII